MSTVLVTPSTIADSHEWLKKYLEESDAFVMTPDSLTNTDLLELGGEATVVATGSWESVRTFAQLVAWHSKLEGSSDIFSTYEAFERLDILAENATRDEDGLGRFEVTVTLPR